MSPLPPDPSAPRSRPGDAVAVPSLAALREAARLAAQRLEWSRAETLWGQLAARAPRDVEALGSLALCARMRGDLDRALERWKQAIEVSPRNAGLWANLGDVFRQMRKPAEAETHIRKALALAPAKDDVRQGLATVLWEQRKINDALELLDGIKVGSPQFSGAENLRGNILSHLGDAAGAQGAYQRAMKGNPQSPLYRSNFLLSLLYDAEADPATVAAHHARFGEHYDPLGNPGDAPLRDPQPGRRLRLGFLSVDFRMHSVAYFVEPLIAELDRRQVEVFLYSGVVHPDDMTRLFERRADHFRTIVGLSPEAIVAQSRADEIDLLIDLGGHTGSNFLPLMARRMAPIQLSWLGYPHSTGLRSIDYRISDAVIEPLPHAQAYSTETILHLPEGCHAYRMPGEDRPVTPLPLRRNGYPTFICCNNSAKISPQTLALWATALRELPTARLIVKNSGYTYGPRRAEILAFFEGEGIAPGRVDLRPLTKDFHEHLDAYGEADIALDTFPYTGTTTTCEAFWTGVPVLTLAGETAASRHSASLLAQVGLADWVASSESEYIAKLKGFTAEVESLSRLRADLRLRFRQSSIGDHAWIARRFESILRTLWVTHCERAGARAEAVAAGHGLAAKVLEVGLAHHQLRRARLALQAGRYAEARPILAGLARAGKSDEAWVLLGQLAENTQDNDLGLECWRAASEKFPAKPELWAARAESARLAGHYAEACRAYAKALARAPQHPGVWMNFSGCCRLANRPTRALVAAKKALQLKPDFPEAWNNLGGACRDLGRFDEAVAAFCKVLELRPDDRVAHSNLLYLLHYVPGLSAADLGAQHRAFGERHFPASKRSLSPVRPVLERPWQIGLLSPDLREHSVAHFVRAVVPALRAAGCTVWAFADHARPDAVSAQLREACDHWVSVAGQDDARLAATIRSAGLDVLLELSGHTAGHRLAALTRRVAPLQLSWLGYPAALEAGVTDFYLGDETLYPSAEDGPGEVLRLPRGYLAYAAPHPVPLACSPRRGTPLTFGAFHAYPKFNTPLWAEWGEILQRFPRSRLVVKSRQLEDPALAARWRRELAAAGLPVDRIERLAYASADEGHLEAWNGIDLALDASPYNGVTTTCEALLMGVPVLTMPGATPASRHAASVLRGYGMDTWVMANPERRLARIARVAGDLEAFRTGRIERQLAFRASLGGRAQQWAEDLLEALERLFA